MFVHYCRAGWYLGNAAKGWYFTLQRCFGTYSYLLLQCDPQDWKYPKVVPLYKDGWKDDMDSYWPISILPVVSKILEKVVQHQLTEYLEDNQSSFTYQCRFRRRHSTELVITFLTDLIRNMDYVFFYKGYFVDFRKAFDTIDHVKVLDKMKLFWDLQWKA